MRHRLCGISYHSFNPRKLKHVYTDHAPAKAFSCSVLPQKKERPVFEFFYEFYS
jgi:hypothetical protein